MTPETKEKIRASMKEHLTSIGYPNISNKRIMAELPNLFRKLDTEGLIPDKMTYQHFYDIAFSKFIEALIRGIE